MFRYDQILSEVELWLREGNDKLNSAPNVNKMDEPALELELRSVNGLVDGLEHTKQQISALNSQSNKLLDLFSRDDNHTLSHTTSVINTQWTKFNDNVRIRRAVLEASLKARSDIQSTLSQLQQWLDKKLKEMRQMHEDTDNIQRLKDTTKRRKQLQRIYSYFIQMLKVSGWQRKGRPGLKSMPIKMCIKASERCA